MLPKKAPLLRAINLSSITKGRKTLKLARRTCTIRSKILRALLAAFTLTLLSAAIAQERATPQEVVDKVKEAANMLSKTHDVEQFSQKQGPWMWKDTYIFVLDCEKVYAILHTRPDIRGLQLNDLKGSSIFTKSKEACEAAPNPDGIWVQYFWAKAGERTTSTKIGYLLGAKGTPYMVGAGISDDEAAIPKRSTLQSVIHNFKPGIITFGFAVGLALFFFFFFIQSGRPFVTGVVFPGPLKASKRRSKIGDYTILSELGRGGMGTVFKGVDRQGQTVAIKLIGGMRSDRRAWANGGNRIGLVHEARLAASLRHLNIVQVFHIDREKDTLYVVMEYLEGVPLRYYIRNSRLGVLEALRIVAELCDALSYAHGRGIIHRDIKPENIFITADKSVKVLDFGIALQGEQRPGVAGTPPYMSPEQFMGTEVDARSDVWSAGVTLFEILTGECPFVAKNLPSLRNKIVYGSLPELTPGIPYVQVLKVIFEKALAKDRESRYQTAAGFGADLRSLILKIQRTDLNGAAITSTPGILDQVLSSNPNESSERTVPLKSIVNLGFKKQLRAPVFVIKPPEEKLWFDAYNLSSVNALGSLVALVGIFFLFIYSTVIRWINLIVELPDQLILEILAALWALVLFGAVVRLVYEHFVPHQVLRCRSCQCKMRTASDWRRSLWLVDREGFCVADCLAALKEDHWQDAVTLFLLHTTEERTDTSCRLTFLECRSCRDQRAYFWFSARWFEAYK